MKLRLTTRLLTFIFTVAITPEAGGVDLEYLDNSRVNQLRSRFNDATRIDMALFKELNQSKWTCDMYGMSSRLQVEKGVKLYYFHGVIKDGQLSEIKNKGAQVVDSYQVSQGLKGQSGSLRDEVRVAKDGKLISRLEIQSPESKSSRILAISVCDRIKI